MKSLTAFLTVLSLSVNVSGQGFINKDTLRFSPDSSYSRTIIRYGKNLVFGTSKNGVIELNEQTGKTKTIIPPSPGGEFRAVAEGKRGIYGIVSGNDGEIWRADKTDTSMIIFFFNTFFDDLKTADNSFIFLGDPDSSIFTLHKIAESMLPVTELNPPAAFDGEACYAASATTLFLFSDSKIAFISGGGNKARFHITSDNGKSWSSVDLPMNGNEGCGPFSLHFTNKRKGMIVGGCYPSPNDADKTSLYTEDGGKSWKVSEKTTNGYRSCVTGSKKTQFACGTNGIDVSTDGGKTWKAFDKGNFCALMLEKKHLYATTNKGYCVRYKLR